MSDKVRAWVWDLDLPPTRKLILLWLAGRATDTGVAFPGEREIREKTGLGERMVRYHLQALADRNVAEPSGKPGPLLLRVERRVRADRNTSNVYVLRVPWAESTAVRRDLEELKHIPEGALNKALANVGVGATGCREESSQGKRHLETPPAPPVGAQQHHGVTAGRTKDDSNRSSVGPPRLADALKLADAFYRGLGGEATAVTAAIRRRDLVIASDLVTAGATPSEAEAYAVETRAVSGRIAPVELRSFERERMGWLARRHGARRESHGFVDRTGQPPSWQTDPAPTARLGVPESRTNEVSKNRALPELARGQLAHALRSVLLTGR